jgi:hypothetical protein
MPAAGDGSRPVLLSRAPHWRLLVRADQPELHARLTRRFADPALVEVILDRRRGDRRRGGPVEGDRRRGERRRGHGQDGYRLAIRMRGYDVYEAEGRVPAECPECGTAFTFEMPRFGEPPARLELAVIHDETRSQHAHPTVRHLVEAQAYSGAARPLLCCRIPGRRLEAS